MTFAALNTPTVDPFATVRVMNRLRNAGFSLELDGADLVVMPFSRLSTDQVGYLKAHKTALVALLQDADTLALALQVAGPDGLDWREGTPPDWSDSRLLAAGEVLYSDRRMVNRNGRRYAQECAPVTEHASELDMQQQTLLPDNASLSPDAAEPSFDELVATLMNCGYARANAEAVAREEVVERRKAS
jgi:hypothetical protein